MKKTLLALTISLLLIGFNVFAADGDLIVNGNIGVGTTTPAVKLDVNGGVRIGSVSLPCSAAIEGAQRYNSSTKAMEFCNGTDWMVFSSTPPPPLPPDAYTKLLLHFDGNGNTFIDSSSSNKTITSYGNVTQSSTQSVFGGKSAYFDGTEDYLSVPNSEDWNFDGDLSIDFWIRTNDKSEQGGALRRLISFGDNSGNYIEIGVYSNAGEIWSNGLGLANSTVLVADNQWHHIAVIRQNSSTKLFIDGNLNVSGTKSGTISASGLHIGKYFLGSLGYYNGYIDELRISKGIARWTSNFTPPTAPY